MPTYDYRCDACENEFEQFQSITARTLRKCPECGLPKLKRLIGTGAGVIFKGSGFYETDYRSESYKKGAKAEKESSSSDTDKSKSSDKAASTSSDSSSSKSSDSKKPTAAPSDK